MLEGGCACGEVRYRLASDPLIVHCCQCLNCQKQTGGAFVINMLIEADRVELLAGEPDSVPAFDVSYDMKALWPAESLERVGRLRRRSVE